MTFVKYPVLNERIKVGGGGGLKSRGALTLQIHQVSIKETLGKLEETLFF